MKDNPLIVSLLLGLIVVLVIGGVSILVKMKGLSDEYKVVLAEKMSLQKDLEGVRAENASLKGDNVSLSEEIQKLNSEVTNLSQDMSKLKELNLKLEDSLKEELIRQKLERK